jgi:hypothetical protein
MSQFPVENEPGLYEGVNYLLSGPAGLGQNFEGFASYTPAYVRPALRAPFTIPLDTTQNPDWYVEPLAIGNIVALDTNSFRVDYATTQSPAPFSAGDYVTIADVSDSSDTSGETFNGSYTVLSGNTTSIVCGTSTAYNWATYDSGGEVGRDWTDARTSTDCNALVTIFGPTDRAFISAQLQMNFGWEVSEADSEFDVNVYINRYRAFPVIGQPGQVVFQFDQTITQRRYHYVESGNGSDSLDTIFTTAIDSPNFGYYWYILEIEFVKIAVYNSSQIGGPPVIGQLRNNRYNLSGNVSSSQYPVTPDTFTLYSGVTGTGGSGSGVTFNVRVYNIPGATVYSTLNIDVRRATGGTDYQVGDIITISGADIGGTTPANDLVMQVQSIVYPGDGVPTEFQVGIRSLTAQVVKE